MSKFIFVTGGVVSSLDKGLASASIEFVSNHGIIVRHFPRMRVGLFCRSVRPHNKQ